MRVNESPEVPEWMNRTALLIGQDAILKLSSAHVLVAGLGGVGGYAAEMLVRTGIGEITIADGDTIHPTNRNRQLIALKSTEGLYKTDVLESRLLDINPSLKVHKTTEFLKEEGIDNILSDKFDYVIDAIDTLAPKISLIYKTINRGYPLISSMGSGGKSDPLSLEVGDISDSHHCRLAYYIRKQLHKLGVREGFKVVFSPEKVDRKAVELLDGHQNKKSNVGTISYMPPLFGIVISSVVIKDLMGSI